MQGKEGKLETDLEGRRLLSFIYDQGGAFAYARYLKAFSYGLLAKVVTDDASNGIVSPFQGRHYSPWFKHHVLFEYHVCNLRSTIVDSCLT